VETDNDRKCLIPGIFDFKRLFLYSDLAVDANRVGFPRGATLAITSHSGFGKSIFALALVRDLMISLCSRGDSGENDGRGDVLAPQLYYVTTELNREQLDLRCKSFGWFVNADCLSRDQLKYITVREAELPKPVRGAEELINQALSKLRREVIRALKPSGTRRARQNVFVIVDSVTALLKDSRDDGDRRRNCHELVQEIQSIVGNKQLEGGDNLALLTLTSELPSNVDRHTTSPEENIADYVFRLELIDRGFGRRLRVLEVAKSQGNPMVLGQHTWAILTNRSIEKVIASRGLLNDTRYPVDRSKEWASIAVFPRPTLPAIGSPDQQRWKNTENGRFASPGGVSASSNAPATIELSERTSNRDMTEVTNPLPNPAQSAENVEGADANERSGSDAAGDPDRISTGIPGLDEMLLGHSEYFARPIQQLLDANNQVYGLSVGSTTLLVGPSGTGKTHACLQFLLDEEHIDKEYRSSVYVNFENRPRDVLRWFPGSGKSKERLSNCHTLYRRRANLDVNALISEIGYLIDRFEIRRIAIDGLSDLLTTIDQHEYSRLVEDLLVSIRFRATQRCIPVTVFIALETDTGLSQFTMEAVSFAADNLIVLRQISIGDERRKTIHILKARGTAPDRQIRELAVREENDCPMRVVPGLENYANLDSPSPRPVDVTIQLFAENQSEEKCNEQLVAKLEQLFRYTIHPVRFSRTEVKQTLADIAAGTTRIPLSDVKILSIDEWWIRELRGSVAVPQGKLMWDDQVKHPLLVLDPFIGTQQHGDKANAAEPVPSDFWVFELEKASILARTGKDAVKSHIVALPFYTDFGLFCIDRDVWKALGEGDASWEELLRRLPRTWVHIDGDWFKPPNLERKETIVDWMHAAVKRSYTGFRFDVETPVTVFCTFLELSWGFGAAEDFLINDACNYHKETNPAEFLKSHPVTIAFRFLMYLVFNGLVPSHPKLNNSRKQLTSSDSRKALFSRHWFSTLSGDPGWEAAKAPSNEVSLCPLPFFPVNDYLETQITDREERRTACMLRCLHDIVVRFDRLLNRVHATVEYRSKMQRFKDQLVSFDFSQAHKDVSQLRDRLQGSTLERKEIGNHLALLRTKADVLRHAVLTSTMFLPSQGVRDEGKYWNIVDPEQGDDKNRRLWLRTTAAIFMDERDVLELLKWHDFRIKLLEAELNGSRSLADVVAHGSGNGYAETTPGLLKALCGYACEGSWMVGAERQTHSPSLAAKFLLEATSLGRAVDRSQLGAGIPSRKDFFSFYGSEPLSDAFKEITWADLLKYTGSRARRRDRAVCSHLRVSNVMELVEQLVSHALLVADTLRSQVESDPAMTTPDHQKERMQEVAILCATRIFESIGKMMNDRMMVDDTTRALAPRPRTCLTCPHPEDCRQFESVKDSK
jgi:KaiC/GvpD/RAD55 family RecA-like ATPase